MAWTPAELADTLRDAGGDLCASEWADLCGWPASHVLDLQATRCRMLRRIRAWSFERLAFEVRLRGERLEAGDVQAVERGTADEETTRVVLGALMFGARRTRTKRSAA